ncbi:MAG: GNAT family N-acetyltransferase, partial [Acidobacteria bacterium]|nr:GNAT family N-acetyltransferase [Acidobacteriota bacterium]
MNTQPDNSSFEIRLAQPSDLPFLAEIETAASELFSQFPVLADLPTDATPLASFQSAQRNQLLWVATSQSGKPVGFALVKLLGDSVHLEEMDVLPEFGRRGIGSKLVRTVCEWTQTSGKRAVTLTTFRDVPWNAPFYRKLGFRILEQDEWTPELHQLVEQEERRGLKRELRVVMRY